MTRDRLEKIFALDLKEANINSKDLLEIIESAYYLGFNDGVNQK